MKWRIIAVGKPALAFARNGIAEYEKRLRRYVPLEVVYLKDGIPANVEARYRQQADGTYRIVLDERGDALNTDDFRRVVDDFEHDGEIKTISLFVGGANGHSKAVREDAHRVLCLSALTLQHELALVVLLEQLYRGHTILRGERYHRC